jgi:hypothetical protein
MEKQQIPILESLVRHDWGSYQRTNSLKVNMLTITINILPLVEDVTVDYHKKNKYHPRLIRLW